MRDAGDSVGPDPRAVVLVLTSVSLHVKISVMVFRVYLGMVTYFWSTFVLGGCNVTFHGIYIVSPRDSFIVGVSMHLWATLCMTCSGSQGDLVPPGFHIYTHERSFCLLLYIITMIRHNSRCVIRH